MRNVRNGKMSIYKHEKICANPYFLFLGLTLKPHFLFLGLTLKPQTLKPHFLFLGLTLKPH